jgi:hypothetical protein
VGLIRLLAIIFLVYLVFRLAARFLFPLVARYFMKKAASTMEEHMKSQKSGEKVFQEGDVEIRKMDNPNSQAASDRQDDYIDFEEIDD